MVWKDPGDFFEEGAEFFDPDQGALGDCYFMAALSAVAWARPYVIAQHTRATGPTQPQFVDRVGFFKEGAWHQIEVSESMPHGSGGTIMYAKSTEAGEIWPAVYEKAYAKWKTGTKTDRPEYPKIAGGDPGRAMTELTGLANTKYRTKDKTAAELYTAVRANSAGRRTINPMDAWTYSSATVAPTPINYSTANLVANHAYTVLGWHEEAGKQYIVLRNPWGWKEASLNVDTGAWLAYDIDWWRTVTLGASGVFALEKSTFKNYFSTLAVAK